MPIDEFKRPVYDRDVNKLMKAYKNALVEVSDRVGTLATLPLSAIDRQQSASLVAQITFILDDLDHTTLAWSKETITAGFDRGYASKIISTANAADTVGEAAKLARFSTLNKGTVDALIADTYNDLLAATHNTKVRIKNIVRRVTSEQMISKASQQLGRKTTNRAIINQLTKSGLSKTILADGWVGITDKAGRRWKLNTYVDMVSRTKLHQAYIEGVKRKGDDRGYDLAVISSHGAKDGCSMYEGAIVSMSGNTPGYPTYDDMLSSGVIFHPNCKHSVSLIRSPDLLPDEVRRKAEGATERAAHTAGMKDYNGLSTPKLVGVNGGKGEAVTPYKYVPAKTIKEANEWAAENLGIDHVDYKGFAVELANDVNKTLEQLRIRFPEVNDTKFIGTIQARNMAEFKAKVQKYAAIYEQNGLTAEQARERAKRGIKRRTTKAAHYAESTGNGFGAQEGIAFNTNWAKDYKKTSDAVANDVKSTWHPKGTEDPSSILTHEFGHQVDNFLVKANIRRTIKEIHNKYTLDEIGTGLSRYARKNDREFFAEAFSEYLHNPNPRPMAAEVGAALEQALINYRKGAN